MFPEDFTYHMLMLYYPFFNDNNLTLQRSYVSKLNSPGVGDLINRNQNVFEPAPHNADRYWIQLQT